MDKMRDYLTVLCAGWPVQQVQRHRRRDAARAHRPAGLRRGRRSCSTSTAPPAATSSSCRSSGEEVVGPIGDMLGVDHVVATRMVVEDGKYTGEIAFYAYGEGKAVAMRELAEERGYDLAECYAYSDSFTDLPMLEAGRPPDGRQPRQAAAPARRRAAAGRCASSAGRCACATGCRRSRRRPARRRRTPGWPSPPAPSASPGGPAGVGARRRRREPCETHLGLAQRRIRAYNSAHGPPPAGGRVSPRRRSVRESPAPTCDQPREARRAVPSSPERTHRDRNDGQRARLAHRTPTHGDGGPPREDRRFRVLRLGWRRAGSPRRRRAPSRAPERDGLRAVHEPGRDAGRAAADVGAQRVAVVATPRAGASSTWPTSGALTPPWGPARGR